MLIAPLLCERQAVMETVALALQAALTLGLGGSIIGALNGMQLVKALVDDHISHLAAPATARIWAVTTISCLVELLSDPQANETSAGRDLPEVSQMASAVGELGILDSDVLLVGPAIACFVIEGT